MTTGCDTQPAENGGTTIKIGIGNGSNAFLEGITQSLGYIYNDSADLQSVPTIKIK